MRGMKVIVTVPRGGVERHLVVEGPEGTTVADVLDRLPGALRGSASTAAPGSGTASRCRTPRAAPREPGLSRPVRHGDDLGEAPQPEPPPAGSSYVVVTDGPDSGTVVPLPPGRWVTVGRDPRCDLTIDDPALSRLHARIRLDRQGVHVEDLGSTNGIRWEVSGEGEVWRPDDRLLLGGSALALLTRPPAPAASTAGDGREQVIPWPRQPVTVPELQLRRPAPPERRRVRRPSAWTWALPLGVALAVAFVLRMPWLLLFGLLGPAMVLGHHLADRRAAREEFEEASDAHTSSCLAVEASAAAARLEEARTWRRRDPGIGGVAITLAPGRRASSALWDGTDDQLRAVVGQGASASAVSVDGEPWEQELAPVVVAFDVPVVVAGPPESSGGIMRSLLLQLTCRHPPSQLALVPPDGAGPGSPDDLRALLAWLPHTSPQAVTDADRVLRWGRDLLLVQDRTAAPPGSTVVDVRPDGTAVVHHADGRQQACAPTLVGRATARRLARRLAPLSVRPRGRHGGGPAQATSRTLGDLAGWPTDVERVIDGWRVPGTAVPLGSDASGAPFLLDLVHEGPHALVAGTTGSGKSELLRTLVTGLALRCSPAELTLLLVDYKGGSSLGECARLPQVTGLVTDLDPHLAERVLVSLQAELTRREELLQSVEARDIGDYTGGDLPRLLIVVDEFRVLAEEVPDVLTRLVRLAAVGRSLGVHLVLATQRPAGVVSADLRANVNLRIALRVRDVADSHDVLDCADAAALPEGRPGLALVRTGPEAPRQVQVARLGRPRRPPAVGQVTVHEHPDVLSARQQLDEAFTDDRDDEGAVDDLALLLHDAARREGLSAPVVWCPPLPDRIDPADATPSAWAVLDRPEAQRREPLVWDPVQHLGLVGSARSGRSTALRSVLGRLQEAWVVGLDLGRSLEQEALRGSPACCAWVGPDETAHGLRVLELLQDLVLRRQRQPRDRWSPVVLAIDGWDRLVDLYGEVDRGRGVDLALRLLREGPAVGVVALVTGDRSLLVGKLAGLLPQTWALPLNDPSDLLLTGLRSSQVPRDRPPGRIVGVRDGVVGQVVLPDPQPAPLAPTEEEAPLRCVALPRSWSVRDGQGPATWAVGGDEALPLAVPTGSLLVLGPPGSGRSSTLHALAALREPPTLVVQGTDPPELDELRARLAAPGAAAAAVIVDDAHLLAGTEVEDVLVQHATTSRVDLLVAADLDQAAGSFRGLVPAAARGRTAVVLQPDNPAQGSVVGAQLPVGDLRVPGRGVLVHRGRCTPLQVLSPPAGP